MSMDNSCDRDQSGERVERIAIMVNVELLVGLNLRTHELFMCFSALQNTK